MNLYWCIYFNKWWMIVILFPNTRSRALEQESEQDWSSLKSTQNCGDWNLSMAAISHIFTWMLCSSHTLNCGVRLWGVNDLCQTLNQDQVGNVQQLGQEHVEHFEFPVSAQRRPGVTLELEHPRKQIFSCSILIFEDQERVCLWAAPIRKL